MSGKTFWGIIGGFVALVVIGIIAGQNSNTEKPAHRAEIVAAEGCASLIKERARDADSVSFITDPDKTPAIHPVLAGIEMKHTWEEVLLVRAANGYGGKTVSEMHCRNLYEDDNGNWTGDVDEVIRN